MPRTSQRRKLSGPIEISKRALSFYVHHSERIIRIVAIQFWAIILTLLASVVVGAIMVMYPFGGVIFASVIALLAIWLLAAMVIVGNKIALVEQINKLAFEENPRSSPWKITKKGMERFWPYVWYSIVLLVISVGAFMLGLVIFSIITAAIFGIFFVFSFYTFALEDRRGITALTTSWQYVKGYWWAVLGRLAFLAVVFCILSLAWAGVMFAVYYLSYQDWGTIGHFSHFTDTLPGFIVRSIGDFLMLFVGMPFAVIYLYGIYSELKVIKGEEDPEMHPAKILWCKVLGIIGLVCIPAIIVITIVLSSTVHFAKDTLRNLPTTINAHVSYSDTEHSLSFTHPSSWKKGDVSFNGASFAYWINTSNNDKFPERMSFKISHLYPEDQNLSDEEYLEVMMNDIKAFRIEDPYFEMYTSQITETGDKKALRILYAQSTQTNDGETIQFVTEQLAFRQGDKLYTFTFSDDPENMSATEDVFLDIVNSITWEK